MSGVRSPSWLHRVLEHESFTHQSHYKVMRHNHIPHGIGALARLGATELLVQEYLNEINKYLPEYIEGEESTEILNMDYVNSDDLFDYRGKNCGTYKMKEKYEELWKKKYNDDMVAMVTDICPAIIDGPLLSGFHGLISIAYGYIGRSDHTMLEGLIFMDQQYSPMISEKKGKDLNKFGQGKTSILDTLEILHENKEFIKQIQEEYTRDSKEKPVPFVQSVYGWPVVAHHGKYFNELTDEIKLPEWFDQKKEDMQQIVYLIEWLFDMAAVIYVKSESKNDFFLLHGLTGSWSYKQILHFFEYKTALLGFRAMVSAILGVYAFQGAPALSLAPNEHFKGDVTEESWNNLIKTMLNGICHGKKYELHIYKLVQVCYENWKERPHSEYTSYYFAAANEAKDNHYQVGGGVSFPNDDLSH